MPKFPVKALEGIKTAATDQAAKFENSKLKEGIEKTTASLTEKAAAAKDTVDTVKEDITNKLTELDRMLEQAITEYNDAYTLMNDKGIKLYIERCRATDTIANVESLVNSIANRPKSFDTEFEEIDTYRTKFIDSCEFADRELQAAREAAGGAGAGLAAGASVAFMAPSAAMWVATTFGTASTGTAISTLSGAAASKAALAWLGGGALSTGGGGVVAGKALLALAGPVGYTIAGAALLSSILLFSRKRVKLNKEKNEEIESVKKNSEAIRELDLEIAKILGDTSKIRTGLNRIFTECLEMYGKDYASFDDEQKGMLGALVNNTRALSVLFEKTVS